MKKLTKDQIQKIVLSTLMMIGLIYCYFTFLIAGLNKADLGNANSIEGLDKDIAKAQSTIKRSSSVEESARSAEETLAQVNDMIPDGAPIAWFPPRMTAFFARHNVKGITTRSNGIDSRVRSRGYSQLPQRQPGRSTSRRWACPRSASVSPAWRTRKNCWRSRVCKCPPRPTRRRNNASR